MELVKKFETVNVRDSKRKTKMVFLGTPYFLATTLLDLLLSQFSVPAKWDKFCRIISHLVSD